MFRVTIPLFEFSHKDNRTLRNQSCTTTYHRTVSSINTPKAVGLCATVSRKELSLHYLTQL